MDKKDLLKKAILKSLKSKKPSEGGDKKEKGMASLEQAKMILARKKPKPDSSDGRVSALKKRLSLVGSKKEEMDEQDEYEKEDSSDDKKSLLKKAIVSKAIKQLKNKKDCDDGSAEEDIDAEDSDEKEE